MRIFTLTAIVVVIASTAGAQNADTPLFAAFKTFCVDTGARPMAVKAAVETAGGTQRGATETITVPNPMTATIWDITVGGRKMTVLAGTAHVPIASGQVGEMIGCFIQSPVDEDASVAAIRDWVGVPASPPSPPLPSWVTMYEFQEDGSVRAPITDEAARRAANARGATSLLTLMQPPAMGTQVQLIHVQGPAP